MPRRLEPGARLVIATHNPGKLREIGELLRPHGLDVVSAGELGLPECVRRGRVVAVAGVEALVERTRVEVEHLARRVGEGHVHRGLAQGCGRAAWMAFRIDPKLPRT